MIEIVETQSLKIKIPGQVIFKVAELYVDMSFPRQQIDGAHIISKNTTAPITVLFSRKSDKINLDSQRKKVS